MCGNEQVDMKISSQSEVWDFKAERKQILQTETHFITLNERVFWFNKMGFYCACEVPWASLTEKESVKYLMDR